MGKKGKGAKKNKQAKEDKEVLPEVDKEFYEIQITDLNQKLARLRSRCSELEYENEDVRKNLQKLDEDRADIIAYLKRTLQTKGDEIAELQERLVALQETREAEKVAFLERIKTMEHDFKSMHEQLNSEIKLLNGKLNSLEEFRRERDDLMNKFLKQEEAMEEQEKRHKITLYEVERKFIIGKDELKKDMENKLLQLSLDFQNTTDIRIATTTHRFNSCKLHDRVIRENVAINNEINVLMESWKNLHEENVHLKKKEKDMKMEAEIQREETKALLKKNMVQGRIIENITEKHSKVEKAYEEMDQVRKLNQTLEDRLELAEKRVTLAQHESQRLRQELTTHRAHEGEHEVELHELRQHCCDLQTVITTASEAVANVLKVQHEPDDDEAVNLGRRETLLTTLLDLFNKSEHSRIPPEAAVRPSAASVALSELYSTGDLGLIPQLEARSETSARTVKSRAKTARKVDSSIHGSRTKRKKEKADTIG